MSRSHVGAVKKLTFDWIGWQANAGSMSHKYDDEFIDALDIVVVINIL